MNQPQPQPPSYPGYYGPPSYYYPPPYYYGPGYYGPGFNFYFGPGYYHHRHW
jgi:hypothetical protein